MKIKTFTPPTYNSGSRGFSSLKSLLLLVAMLMVATSNAFAQASFETIDGIRYLIDTDAKTATVVASSGDKYSGDVVVPEKVKASDETEYPITAFGENAFKGCSSLTSITIPSSVTSLGNYCFYDCSKLASITIPSSVTSLGDNCFYGCSSLTSVTIPSSVTSLSNYCFSYCSKLTSITIPSSVTSLSNYCFCNCTSLTSISIPSSVISLGAYCFSHCSNLSSITIPSSVAVLGSFCFQYCTSLTSITIPSSVTSLGDHLFFRCYSLTSVSIPSTVTYLGTQFFAFCSSLTSITIPSSVTSLRSLCFQECTKLEQVIFRGKCLRGVIDSKLLTSCIIYVPKDYLQDYKDALGSTYPYIYASKDDDGDDNPSKACATPTITYSDGELQFASATEGAQYHYTLTSADFKNDAYSEDGKVELAAAYNITAYATADGYKTSDKATAVLYWVKANGNLEGGTSTNINQAKTRGIVATSRDGIVTLSGLDNGEEVRFYSVDGKQIGATKAIEGAASQAVSSASLVIAKIGGQAIKIAVK